MRRGAVGSDLARLDDQVAVVIAHDAHVAGGDAAVAHGDVVARGNPDAGTVVAVARVLEFEVLHRDIVRFNLKHSARVRQRSVHVLARGIKQWTGSAHAAHEDGLGGGAGTGPAFDFVVG